MDRNGTLSNFRSEFENDGFKLYWDDSGRTLNITSSLQLTPETENYNYEVYPLARKSLRENMIYSIFVKSGTETRVGWVIPAIALSSDFHDYAEKRPFLDFAYVAIREVLSHHPHLFADRALAMAGEGATALPFSDLFDDNVCFLVVCTELMGEPFDSNRFLPSLIALGYLPLDACDPNLIEWTSEEFEPTQKNLRIRQTGSGIVNPELPARLVALAASSNSSLVMLTPTENRATFAN